MDNITTKKIDDFTLEITKEILKPEPIKTAYERSFIENQIKTIQADKDNYVALRDAELVECNSILAEMDKLNIVSKVETLSIMKEVINEEIIK